MRFLLAVLFLTTICGCSTDSRLSKTTKVHGEIVNPLDSFLVLSKNGQIIDTILIDDDGRFNFAFTQNEEAIYFFKHGAEKQMLYTQPGDSIAFRLNTLAFDETLVFDANSSAENNFLINCFLLNEKNNDIILQYHKIRLDEFLKLTDSLKSIQLQKLEKLKSKHNLSPFFVEIAEKSIYLEFFDMKERYAFLIQKYFSEKADELKKSDFFEYRNQINFNDEKLFSHIGYLRFIDNYLKNKSIEDCLNNPEIANCFDIYSYQNLHKRIEIVNELFDENPLKEQLLKRFIRIEIIHCDNEEQIANTLSFLNKMNLSKEDSTYYHRLAEFQSNFLVGKSIKNHSVFNHEFEIKSFQEIADNKPMLVYLWSANNASSHQKRLTKIKELREKFPEIKFIGINIDYTNKQLWERTLTQYKYNKNFEYQVIEGEAGKNLYENYLSKVFFIDANTGKIQKSNHLLYSDHLESSLVAFLNQ